VAKVKAGRAGVFIQQASGSYTAFIPAPLPPEPSLNLNEHLNLLLEAERSLGRLEGATQLLPNHDLLVLMYIRAEAVLSSQIEGTQASLDDVLKAEANLADPNAPDDVSEVINYIAAMNYGLERRSELPMSLRLIREIHQQLMEGVRGSERNPGAFRRTQNWIGPAGSTLRTARYVPPPVPDMLDSLNNLEKFIYEEASKTPLLVKIGLIHAQFETIHPFLDGNGRTGRLLITLLMCHYELLSVPMLYLSYFFKLHRSEYYDRLQAVRERGDWEGWLRFFLEGVKQVADEASEKTRKILALREFHRILISQHLGRKAAKALQLHEYLLKNPFINIKKVREVTKQSYSNANTLVGDLLNIGLLHNVDERERDRQFVYKDYLNIFQLEPGITTTDVTETEATLS
jgi:Fic family protein